MVRPRSIVPKLVHHKPSGQARVGFGSRDLYCGPWGSSEAQETDRSLVAEYLRTGEIPGSLEIAQGPAPVTVNELILHYWKGEHYVKNGEPTTQQQVITQTLRVLQELFGTTPACEFGPKRLKTLRQEMISKGWKRASINKRIDCIRRVFGFAVEEEHLHASVWHALLAVKRLKKGRTAAQEGDAVLPVSQEVINATLAHLPQTVADMVRLQLLSGCRPGEICILRSCDVDRSGDVWEYCPRSHKNEHHGKERRIYLGPRCQAILNRYLENRPADAYCFCPRRMEQAVQQKSPACKRKPAKRQKIKPKYVLHCSYNKDTYRRAVNRACEAALGMRAELRDIRRSLAKRTDLSEGQKAAEKERMQREASEWRAKHCWSPNQLQHSRATYLRKIYGIEAVQVILGHSSLSTTEVYAEADFARAREVMAEVG